jgi:hypothetical protein
MSKQRKPADHHFHYGAPYRYVATHFGLNRAERRRQASRDAKTNKLMTPEAENVPYSLSEPTNEEATDA